FGVFAWTVEHLGVTPRALGPYLERRASGHNPVIVAIGDWLSRTLLWLDRGPPPPPVAIRLRLGAQPSSPQRLAAADRGAVLVDGPEELVAAMAKARPGDTITLLPGTYRFRRNIPAARPGADGAPITVRAQQHGMARLEFAMSEGFHVSAPYWVFENLHIRGVCRAHADCEHAFHVVGKAHHFIARNNTILDFNAHFKINGHGGDFPDRGIIEGNTLTNSAIRQTHNPVTPVDVVAASDWVVRGNLISDFIKGSGDRVSYGGFFKGAGSGNRFERNVVLCESALRGAPGQRVGLSLGGGGTGQAFCRDRRCITEQDGGVIQANLIASCSDDGIYLNRAATSQVLHNTLLDTGSIVVRFPASSADVEGNLVDGAIRSRDGGLVRASGNRDTSLTRLFLGGHPVRGLFEDAGTLDLGWRADGPPRVQHAGGQPRIPDLCGVERPARPALGAFENFTLCLR
ncbi:MAG: right-handed parallel beta-helix repeat-containing protein, partial [Noviherbaspirillum sp.]